MSLQLSKGLNTIHLDMPAPSGKRMALVYLPTALKELRDKYQDASSGKTIALTVLLALHGAGTCAEAMVGFSGLNEVADAKGWVIVYPNGSGRTPQARTWNGRADCGFAGRNNIDDVGFIAALMDALTTSLGAARVRFFAVGMSNGGMMCYRLADELPGRFLAIASVAGVMASPPRPGHPVSVLHLHGTDDEFVPFDGGTSRRSQLREPMLSVMECVNAWAARNECPVPSVRKRLTSLVDDGTNVEYWDFGEGRAGARVHLYQIQGGGHTWPGRQSEMEFLGVSTQNLDANAVITAFFERCDLSMTDK